MGAQRDQCTRLSSLRPIPEVPSAPLLPTNLSHACPSSLEPCTSSPVMDPVIHPSTHSRGSSPSTFLSMVSGPSPQPLLAATREPGASEAAWPLECLLAQHHWHPWLWLPQTGAMAPGPPPPTASAASIQLLQASAPFP